MANDFSAEASVKALWRFEPGALNTDSKGTNTLTPHNTPSEDTSDYKEGACAVSLLNTSSQYFNIPDANLDSGFPFKSGDTTKLMSLAFYHRCVYGTANRHIMGKWNENGKRSWILTVTSSGVLRFYYSTDGAAVSYKDCITFTANRWYHIGVAVNGPNAKLYVRVKDTTTGTNYYYTLDIGTPYVSDADLSIGAIFDSSSNPKEYFYGKLDEIVVFNRLVGWSEFDKIYAGTFSGEDVLAVSGVGAEVEYLPTPKIQVLQLIAQVEWIPTDPNVHVYAGSITTSIIPQGDYGPVWQYAGSAPIAVAVQGEYNYSPPGTYTYNGSVGIVITPDADWSRGFSYISAGIGVGITPQAESLFPDHFYESPGIEISITPAASYRTPIPGWDVPSGYGLVDFTDLGDPPPYWCIDTDGLTLALDNTAEKFDLYAEYLIETDGGVVVGGGCEFEVVDPGIAEISTAGGVKVGGDFDVDFPEPWITSLALEGGVSVGGALGITEFDPATSLITEITTSKGVVVGGYLGFSFVEQKELVTTISVSGGVVVGERRYPPIEFISPVPEEVYYELTTGGTVYVGGELGIDIPEPGVYEWTIRRGGVKVGGACTFGFWIPPITQFDILGGVLVEGSIIEDLELFETWALTGFAYSPSMYSRFNFNSYADQNGQILAAKEDGIYVLEGDDDDGQQIHDGLRLGPANFGTDNLKGARAIYPGDAGIPEAHVIAETKGREGYFKLQRDRFNVTTDILDRIMTIEIADFEKLSHFEIIPVVRVKR